MYAIQLIDVFRGLIPPGGTRCPGTRRAISKRLSKEGDAGYHLFVYDDEDGCSAGDADDFRLDFCTDTFIPTGIDVGGNAGRSDDLDDDLNKNNIGWCKYLLDTMSTAIDRYLYFAAVMRALDAQGCENPTSGGPSFSQIATGLGKLALGGVAEMARLLLHEMIHIENWEYTDHCDAGCCFSTLSSRWMCRVASTNGLYQMNTRDAGAADIGDTTSRFDIHFGTLGTSDFDAADSCDSCSDGRENCVNANWRARCVMHRIGVPSDSHDWHYDFNKTLNKSCGQCDPDCGDA